jgi:hypothetical protein
MLQANAAGKPVHPAVDMPWALYDGHFVDPGEPLDYLVRLFTPYGRRRRPYEGLDAHIFRAETVSVLFYLAPRAYHSIDLEKAKPDILTPREPIAVKGVQTAHTLLIRAEVLGSFSRPEGATLGTHILPGSPYMVEAKAVKPIPELTSAAHS